MTKRQHLSNLPARAKSIFEFNGRETHAFFMRFNSTLVSVFFPVINFICLFSNASGDT
jgi:hypothetical protein